MLNRDYGSSVAGPRFTQVETSFLGNYKKVHAPASSHNACLSHINSGHTSAHTLPSRSGPSGWKAQSRDYSLHFSHVRVMVPNWTSHLLWSCQFLKSSSITGSISTHSPLFPRCCFSCPSLIRNCFPSQTIRNTARYQQENSWWETSYSTQHPQCTIREVSGTSQPWTCPVFWV